VISVPSFDGTVGHLIRVSTAELSIAFVFSILLTFLVILIFLLIVILFSDVVIAANVVLDLFDRKDDHTHDGLRSM